MCRTVLRVNAKRPFGRWCNAAQGLFEGARFGPIGTAVFRFALFRTALGGIFFFDLLGELVHLRLAFAFDAEQRASTGNARFSITGKLGSKGLLDALPTLLEFVVHSLAPQSALQVLEQGKAARVDVVIRCLEVAGVPGVGNIARFAYPVHQKA